MLLCNLSSPAENELKHITIRNAIIESVESGGPPRVPENAPALLFQEAMAFPGLINSHDHLDFNCFPRLGSKIYSNYTEWGRDIRRSFAKEIHAVLKIPQALRASWGIYKNLINGVTTVVNHGTVLAVPADYIEVFQNIKSLHSVRFEKYWKLKINRPFAGKRPFVIHIGEGTDKGTEDEIDELIHWNLFKREIIGIHAVAMKEHQAGAFRALVWCPASNHFMLGRTAAVDKLKRQTPILFGTDSTLTGGWNLWEQLRAARAEQLLTDSELFDAMTASAAQVWRLPLAGRIQAGQHADLVIAKRKKGLGSWDAFYQLSPVEILLVICRGQIRLFDERMADQLSWLERSKFSKIFINRSAKYLYGKLPALVGRIREICPNLEFPIEV